MSSRTTTQQRPAARNQQDATDHVGDAKHATIVVMRISLAMLKSSILINKFTRSISCDPQLYCWPCYTASAASCERADEDWQRAVIVSQAPGAHQ